MLRCLLIWRTGNGAKPRYIKIKWYVADTPRPAILGLPTSEKLKVITLNCTVRITHESSKLLDKKSHNMGEHDGTSPHPVAQNPKSVYTSSKKQLIKDQSHCFEGTGIFPGRYTYKDPPIKDAKSVINPQ